MLSGGQGRLRAGIGVQMTASVALAVDVAVAVWLMRGHPWQADAPMSFSQSSR